jgi:hypothetical protein
MARAGPLPLTLHSPRMHGKPPFYAAHNENCLRLIGSSAILVHRTALCLLSLGRGYSRLHGVAAVCCDAETRDELSIDFIRRRSGPIGCSANGGERFLARITSGHSSNKLKTLKRSLFGTVRSATVCRAWFIPIEGLLVH